MEIRKCIQCGKEFSCKPSSKQKYCCRKCSTSASKGKKFQRVDRVKVTCSVCGKEEFVTEVRSIKYKTCSVKCQHELLSKKFSQKIECTCPVCGKVFKLKPYSFNKSQTHCCSVKCLSELKKVTFSGSNNHQYGLKGNLNNSFINKDLIKRNGHQTDIYVYDLNCPDSLLNKMSTGRVKLHRKLIYDNKHLFNPCIFDEKGILKNKIQVHHIDCNHDHNNIENLIPLLLKEHTKVHNLLGNISSELISSIIGVVKQGELLETPEEDNQQPSLYGNIFEGSETNSRIQLDSNADTSALLQQIIDLLNDYIVQTRTITKEAYDASIQEILESEIKSSEIKQRIIEENQE